MKQTVVKPFDAKMGETTTALIAEPTLVLRAPARPITKSLLRYPGGKSKAVKQILALMPPNLDALFSPFVGGASVELACASRGANVQAFDAFEPLVEFWQVVVEDAVELARIVSTYHPLNRSRFYELQTQFHAIDQRFERAAAFYVLNRASYSGTTLSGGMSPGHPRFTESSIERLRSFNVENFAVQLADFRESIPSHPDVFMYLDPPYANGEKLYGDRGNMHHDFDHEALAALIRNRERWVLSYNDCEIVRDLYAGHQLLEIEWAYGMANNRASNEVIILSRDYEPAP